MDTDEGKARHYKQIAAMGGHPIARYNLGYDAEAAGNMDRANYMISARRGFTPSMENIKAAYLGGIGLVSVEDSRSY